MVVGVQGEAEIGMQEALVQVLGAVDPVFLCHGEDHLQGPVGDIPFLQLPQGLQDGGDTGLVIASQDGGAVGADDAVLYDGLDSFAGLHTVHVGGEHNGGGLNGAGEISHQVARIAS